MLNKKNLINKFKKFKRYEWAKFQNNFLAFFPSIFGHNLQTHTPIELKLGTHKGLLKHISKPILVGIWFKIYGVTGYNQFFVWKKSNISQSYRVAKPLEGIGWNLACRWSNHCRSAFLWFEMNREKDYRDMAQNPTGVKIMQIKPHPVSCTATVQSSELKIGEVVIIETPCSSKELRIWVKTGELWSETQLHLYSARWRYSNRTVTLIEHSASLKVIQ